MIVSVGPIFGRNETGLQICVCIDEFPRLIDVNNASANLLLFVFPVLPFWRTLFTSIRHVTYRTVMSTLFIGDSYVSRFKDYVRNGQHLSDVFNIHSLDHVHFFGIRGGSVLNPRHLELLSNTIKFYSPSHLIVHIGGNDLGKRDDCTELCILKLIAFLTQMQQSCSVHNITVLKLIPRKVTRHTCPTDFNSRVVKANSLL